MLGSTIGFVRGWIQSMRPLGQANLFPFLFLGQSVASHQTGVFNITWFLLSLLWLGLLHLLIVWTNEISDVQLDAESSLRTLFSGGSGVLVQRKISIQSLQAALLIVFVLFWIVGIIFSLLSGEVLWLSFNLLSCLLIFIYDLPPFRFSYRGFGEVFQGLGGVLLLLLGGYVQSASLQVIPWTICVSVYLFSSASHILTALPDVENDKRFSKKTFAVRFGVSKAFFVASCQIVFGFLLCGFYFKQADAFGLWMIFLGVFVCFCALFIFFAKKEFQQSGRWLQVTIGLTNGSWVVVLLSLSVLLIFT